MEQTAVRDQASWDQVANNFDLLFSRVDDILDTQIKLEAQYDMTNKVVEQMMKDQQLLAKQIENTGQAVARLTLDSTRRQFREPDSPTASEASADPCINTSHAYTNTPSSIPATTTIQSMHSAHTDAVVAKIQ